MYPRFRPLVLRSGVAVLGVTLAVVVAWLLAPLEQGSAVIFLIAVLVVAWYAGLGPGLLATALAVVALDYFFLPPVYELNTELTDVLRLGGFALVAGLICSLMATRRRLETTLRQQDRRKDDFLAQLAHELRNPLAAVLHAAYLLRQRGADAEDQERAGEIVERQARHMVRLVEDLLDASRIGRGKIQLCKERLDLGGAVAHAVETLRPLAEARQHRLEVVLPAAPISLEADPTRLEQILTNLLTNAIRYTEPGGHILVLVEQSSNEVRLRVRDTGKGLPPELLPHVFDLFVQAEPGCQGGLGIGLHLVRALVQLHGGTITVTSGGPGAGSEFVVRLPAPPLARTESAALAPASR